MKSLFKNGVRGAFCVGLSLCVAFGVGALLTACEPEQLSGMPATPAANPPTEDFSVATSYDEIFERIMGGLDAAVEDKEQARIADDAAVAAYQEAEDAAEGADGSETAEGAAEGADEDAAEAEMAGEGSASRDLSGFDDATRAFMEAMERLQTGVSAINPRIATVEDGAPTLLNTTERDERGYLYSVNSGVLRVLKLEGAASTLVASVGLYGYDGGSEDVLLLELSGTTLVAQCLVEQRDNDYESPDYALAAYAAPRTTLMFFDVSKPEKPRYLRTLGITGLSEAGQVRDGRFYVVANHATASTAYAGFWDVGSLNDPAVDGELIKKAFDLRKNDPISFVPSFYDDGNLMPLTPDQIYLPLEGNYTTATVFACFDIEQNSCLSLFATYNPTPDILFPLCTWGDENLYLYWQDAGFDESVKKMSYVAHLARISLDGAAPNGFAAYGRVDDTRIYAAFLQERDGQLAGAVEHIGADYQPDWSFVSFDDGLAVIAEIDALNGADSLGSFSIIGDRAYAITTNEERPFVALDIADLSAPKLLGRGSFVDWPQKLAEVEDGLLVGYGSELVREQVNRAAYDPDQRLPELAEYTFLRLYTVSGTTASAVGEARAVTLPPDFVSDMTNWTHEVQVYRDLGLIGVPLVDRSGEAMLASVVGYAFYRVSDRGIESATSIDLTTLADLPDDEGDVFGGDATGEAGDDVSTEATETEAEEEVRAEGYRVVFSTYDESNIYLLCYPHNDSMVMTPQMLILDRNTLAAVQTVPL
jgi:hypothetical protein